MKPPSPDLETRRCARPHVRIGRPVLDQDLFAEILVNERKRSDRSNLPFVLLVFGLKSRRDGDALTVPGEVIAALTATARATDIVGWVERPSLIGVVLPEIRASDLSTACHEIETRFRGEIAKRIETDSMKRLFIASHSYPESKRAADDSCWPLDPILYPDLYLDRSTGRRDYALKRALDIVGSLALLVALSPLFLLAAAAVRFGSHGPVLFRQVRMGRMARPFTMLKFRTMYTGTDDRVHQDYVSAFIRTRGQAAASHGKELFKLANDPRITPVGALLRKTSLDELPQLWNVLRGDMSLVGPRPPLPYELAQYDPWHRCRILEAKPGITGLWQVTGRSTTTFDEMVRLDLRYVRTRSLWTDVRILLATPVAVLSGKGAC